MYIFRLEGKNSNKRQNVIKKFAIIHWYEKIFNSIISRNNY
jgi:hypothetical protein